MSSPKQITLAELVSPGGVEWEDVRVGLHLIPDLPCPKPSAAMVESVRVLGILQPVVLVENEDCTFDVRAGRRRIKAARLAGLTDVPARVASAAMVNLAGASAITLIENEQRSSNPAVELEAISALIEHQMTETDIAKATGIAVGTIRKRARLRQLIPDLRDLFHDGRISPSVAQDAARLSKTDQYTLVQWFVETGRLKRDDVAAVRKRATGAAVQQLDPALFSGPGIDLPAAESVPAARTDDAARMAEALSKIIVLASAKGDIWRSRMKEIREIAEGAIGPF